jgi:(1->4)-alpha-D-glucan 1-alpha-D-glucosylmutase
VGFDVAMRFQQYTAPVQAKGVEDTAFYRHHVLLSLNEVGGDPGRFGRSVNDFHRANERRRRHWPGEMLATTTHDTKRSEDARARIDVISEIPDTWASAVARWRRVNAPNRTRLSTGQAPDRNDEYLFYQALLGAWPMGRAGEPIEPGAPAEFVSRLRAYMFKAIKEAKLHTSWITPNRDYEAAVDAFVGRTLSGATAPAFLGSFVPFVRQLAGAGMVNSLAQLVLKLTAPGVTDVYQGTELWDLSLVDPDNRRPVDFGLRRRLLQDLEPFLSATGVDTGPAASCADAIGRLLDTWEDGRIKLFVMSLGLRLRRHLPDLFLEGGYTPLAAEGDRAGHVVALERHHASGTVVAVVPRLTMSLGPHGSLPVGTAAWGDTRLKLRSRAGRRVLRNLLTGERHEVADRTPAVPLWQLLRTCPVALLWEETPGERETRDGGR